MTPPQKKPHRLFYCNPLFDCSLGNFDVQNLKRAAEEMGTLFTPCIHSGDVLLLKISVPDTFREYYLSHGLDYPRLVIPGEPCASATGVPWGWNADAAALFAQAGAVCVHPDLSVVRKVNSRRFSFALNKKTKTGVPKGRYCDTFSQLIDTLKTWQDFPMVIKPAFGNAGYGFIRKTGPGLSENESRNLDRLFTDGNGVVAEPWYRRTADISSRCAISSAGKVSGVRHHQTLSNQAGTFFGDVLDANDTVIRRWREKLDKAVLCTAEKMFAEGYFGPAGFDSFLWPDNNGTEHLAAIIEINARHPMSSVAYALHDRLAPERVSLFRFIGKKRHTLPDTYGSFLKIPGGDAYNPDTKKGVFLVTPLRVSHGRDTWIQPARSAFFLVEETPEKLLALDEKLRKIFKK